MTFVTYAMGVGTQQYTHGRKRHLGEKKVVTLEDSSYTRHPRTLPNSSWASFVSQALYQGKGIKRCDVTKSPLSFWLQSFMVSTNTGTQHSNLSWRVPCRGAAENPVTGIWGWMRWAQPEQRATVPSDCSFYFNLYHSWVRQFLKTFLKWSWTWYSNLWLRKINPILGCGSLCTFPSSLPESHLSEDEKSYSSIESKRHRFGPLWPYSKEALKTCVLVLAKESIVFSS